MSQKFESTFVVLSVDDLEKTAQSLKKDMWHFVQMHAVLAEQGVDLIYTFLRGEKMVNYKVAGVAVGAHVPSITGDFLAAFVFENETHDLFGISFDGLAIDFEGTFYALSEKEPMTVISPEKLAAREKARKLAAAKAAKEKTAAQGKEGASDAEVEAKLAAMDPEKAAKVRAAMEAKARKAAKAAKGGE